ncbi:MAG: FHA domain-containing protein [Kiritimatiellae bacterium]|nr:FHA domain-containing protein [Kiritimatiellia bacterium]
MIDFPLSAPDGGATRPDLPDQTLLGNVLTVGARLVSDGILPAEVVEERPGAYALCRIARESTAVRILHAGDALEAGRAPAEDTPHWQIADPWMSARHFALSVTADGVPELKAIAAKNGLFVNDRAVGGTMSLRRGDVIRAGTSSFLLL